MKAHVLKHTVCAPNDITVLSPAHQSLCAKAHRVCQPLYTQNQSRNRLRYIISHVPCTYGTRCKSKVLKRVSWTQFPVTKRI